MSYRTDLKIKIPELKGKIIHHHKKDSIYIELITKRDYKKEKQNANLKKISIGKVINEDPDYMYPNDNYFEHFNIEQPIAFSGKGKRSSLISIGTNIVINKILEEYNLTEIAKEAIGEYEYGLLLDLVNYSIITENNIAQHYNSYARNHILYAKDMHIYSDSAISSFMNMVSKDQQEEFFKLWNNSSLIKKDEEIRISYDFTNKNVQAGNINIADFGHAKQNIETKIFNYSIALNQTNKIPICMEKYNSLIIDVPQLESAVMKVKSYGYKNLSFILDRGYCSSNNIKFLLKNDINFFIIMKGHKDILATHVLKNKGTFENSFNNEIEYYGLHGITVKDRVFLKDKDLKDKDFYIHIFYSTKRCLAETEVLSNNIRTCREILNKAINTKTKFRKPVTTLFDLVYTDGVLTSFTENAQNTKDAFDVCGYFGIISSNKTDFKEALTLYEGRDSSEKLFNEIKSFLEGKNENVHSKKALDTKMFIEFIALIVRNKIYNNLHEHKVLEKKNKNYLTVPAAIKQLEMIELSKNTDNKYVLAHDLTQEQKDILEAFDLNEEKIKEKVDSLSQELTTVLEKDKEDELYNYNILNSDYNKYRDYDLDDIEEIDNTLSSDEDLYPSNEISDKFNMLDM